MPGTKYKSLLILYCSIVVGVGVIIFFFTDILAHHLAFSPIEYTRNTDDPDELEGNEFDEQSGAAASTSIELSDVATTSLEEDTSPSEIDDVTSAMEDEENSQTEQPEVPSPPAIVKTPLKWGVYAGYRARDIESFEQMVGSEVDMRAIFVNWYDDFPSTFGRNLRSDGKTMVIFWEQYDVSLDSIIEGDSDEYIRAFAEDAQLYGGQIILAPLHEMNGDWYPWSGTAEGNSPMKVAEAWRHIVTVFGSLTNVKFTWTINNLSVPNTDLNAISHYYPGNQYVDYVAVDGFNFGTPWQSFGAVFDEALNQLKEYRKPIYILSMASAAGTEKATWITDAFTNALPKHPEVVGWVWFNEDKERDWRVNSDSAALSAFKSILP
jgi:hypothetical protein